MSRKKKLIWIAPLAILGMAAFIALGGYIVLQLWNWLLPALFGFRMISFWQALGILILCRILFGGFGMHGGRRRRGMKHPFEGMTPEEREHFRQRMREWAGSGPSPAPSGGQ
jgi:hypothetical protein